jgi:hypothetical protein
MRVEVITAALLLVVAGARPVRAQPSQPAPPAAALPAPSSPPAESLPPAPPEPPPPVAACVPDCRAGFTCVEGRCVSACNPSCPAGQECVEGARCVAPDTTALKATVKQAMAEYYEEKRAEYRAKSIRRHDGWYVRFGFNAGYAWDRAEFEATSTTSKGAGGFIDYAFGGNLSDHVVLAFAHHTFGVFSPATAVEDTELETDHTAFYQVLGMLLDYYPDPTGGWHVTLTLGIGDADIQNRDNESTGTGVGLALGGGHDFWIGEQWSLGLGARLIYIAGAEDDFGNHRAVIPMLAFSALYH